MKVIRGILRDHLFKIGQGSAKVTHESCSHPSTVKRVERVGAGRDRLVVTLAGSSVLPFFEIQIGEFLIISRGGVIQNGGFEFVNPPAPGKYLEGLAHQASVRNDFRNDV